MNDRNLKWLNIFTLALGIGTIPPLWAVLAPYIGVSTGAVALICAGVFVASGNKYKDAFPVCAGFLLGDLWAVLALKVMDIMNFNPNGELYSTLFALGAAAVIISSFAEKIIYLPSWLSGWAIGMTILAPIGIESMGTLPVQIGVSMIIGVVYVGIGVDFVQKNLLKVFKRDNK